MRVFAVSIIAILRTTDKVGAASEAAVVCSRSPEEAEGFGLSRARKNWPVSEGWEQHKVSLLEVPPEWLNDVAVGKW